jgi:hypothetical protein
MSQEPSRNDNAFDSSKERIDAIEMLLQQLVLMLEFGDAITAARLARWCSVATSAMRAHGSAPEAQIASLDRLVKLVTE